MLPPFTEKEIEQKKKELIQQEEELKECIAYHEQLFKQQAKIKAVRVEFQGRYHRLEKILKSHIVYGKQTAFVEKYDPGLYH